MLSGGDLAVIVLVSYYSTGLNMLAFHRSLSPVDQPGYIRQAGPRRFLTAAVWPLVARLNGEFGWFAVTFASTLLIVGVAYKLLGGLIASVFWRVLLIGIVSITPVFTLPLALVATVLFLVAAKPFGARPPSGMDRMRR